MSGTRGGRTWSKKPPHSSYTTKSAPRFHCGDSMKACTTSAMNACPARMSPCGCSSPRGAAALVAERGVHERQRRQRSLLAAQVEVLDARGPREALLPPQCGHGQVVEEVAAVHP